MNRWERFTWGVWWIDAVLSVCIGIGMQFVMYVSRALPSHHLWKSLTLAQQVHRARPAPARRHGRMAPPAHSKHRLLSVGRHRRGVLG